MAKRTETQLVISAKDLGSKKLKDLGAAFRQLRQEQRETAAVADRTKVKQGELQATLTGLNRVLNELQARGSKLDYLKKLGQDSASSKTKIESLKAALGKLTSETDAAGKKTDAYKEKKSKLTKDLAAEERRLKSLSESYIKTANAIEALGLNSQQAQQQLARLIAVTNRAATETEGALARLPREQRLYREEIERTTAAEKARLAAEKQANAEAQQRLITSLRAASIARRNTERTVTSGFGAFSQRADVIAEAAANAERRRSLGVIGRLRAELIRLGAAAEKTAASQNRLAKSTRGSYEAQRTALSFSQRLRGQILSLGAAYFGVFGVISQGQKAIDVSNQRIALNARLLVANGDSATAAADDLKFLRDEAQRLGFSLTELGANYSKLAIAGRAAGLETSQVREIFSNFAEAARVNNAGVEETERVFKALEQILSKGKVQAEELRGQLGDVLPAAYAKFAASLGVTGEELDELLKKGRVSSNALLGFSREIAKSVEGQLEPSTKTLRSELGRLNTAYEDFIVTIGDKSLAPALAEVADALTKFFKSAEGKKFGDDLAVLIRGIGEVAIYAARNLGDLITFAKLFLAVWIGGKIAGLANEFIVLAGNINRAATAAKKLYDAIKAGEATGGLARLIRLLGNPVFLVAAASFGVLAYEINQYRLATERAKGPTDAMRQALEDLEAARGTDEEGKARRRVEALGREAKARIGAARAALEQAEANLALSRTAVGPMGEPGERAARASTELAFSRQLQERKADLAQLENDVDAYNREILGIGKGKRGGKAYLADRPAPEPPALTSGDEDNKAAEKAAEELKRLKEQAADEIAQINKDRLQQELEDEKKALDARIELNRIEYAERRAKNDEAIAKLRAAGANAEADALAAAQKSLDAQEKIADARIRADAAQQARSKQIQLQEEAINRLFEERDRKIAEIEAERKRGEISDAEATRRTYEVELTYQDKIFEKVVALRDFITKAMADGSMSMAEAMELDKILQGLDSIEQRAEAFDPVKNKVQELNEQIAGGLTDSIATLAGGFADLIRGVGSFKDAIKGAWDAFRNFIADFLIEIGKAIIKQMILNALVEATKNSTSGFGAVLNSVAGAMLGTGSAHVGGIVGQQAKTRTLSPAIFAAAQRYHTGGVVGLGPDEVPIVAKRGEEVLTQNDPRHRANGGMAGQQIKIVNAIDSASVVQEGLRGDAGTRAILNVVRANKAAFKAAIT